jgi:HSP20 family protein
MDAWETESAFVVQLDLPGVAPENVDVSFERNTLTIRGRRAETIPAPEKDGLRVYANERPCGEFARTVRFPQYVVGDGIQAQFANGVLTVTVPKADAAKPRKIAVMASVEAKQVPGTQAVAS